LSDAEVAMRAVADGTIQTLAGAGVDAYLAACCGHLVP
jgi:hypothetical protein